MTAERPGEPGAEEAPDLDAATLEADAEVEPVEPAPTDIEPARPVARRRGVGPFSLRQVTIAIVAIMATATVLTVATIPLATTAPHLPVPDPSAFLIGSPIPGLQVGDLAPELVGDGPDGPVELRDLDGNPVRLADLRGRAVWINFWASWCPPCQYETPTIRAIDERFRDRGLEVVAVQVQQTVQAGRDYAERYGLEYTIGADVTGAIFHAYRVFALPTQFFIDANGVIRRVVNGPVNEATAAALVESILPPGSSAAPSASPAAPSAAPSKRATPLPIGTFIPARTPR